MRRRRFQRGSLKPRKRDGKSYWYAQWREGGAPKSKELGLCSKVSKSKAEGVLAEILQPVNEGVRKPPASLFTFEQFVDGIYLPIYRRKWKKSTAGTSEQNIQHHLVGSLGPLALRELERDRAQLQTLLDSKALSLSRSVVGHLRWHLVSIFQLAIGEGAVDVNPARALCMPRCKAGKDRRDLTADEVKQLLKVLDLRERLICRLAMIEGMRPGEVLALQVHDLDLGVNCLYVRRRVYRGEIDSPKTQKSEREVGLSPKTIRFLTQWLKLARDPRPEGWVFPAENLTNPVSRDNVWRRNILPKLEKIGLGWANFQVMRRANTNLGRQGRVDDKVASDQRGHGLGVSLDVYANSGLEQKLDAVRRIAALVDEEEGGF
jgi:integrase